MGRRWGPWKLLRRTLLAPVRSLVRPYRRARLGRGRKRGGSHLPLASMSLAMPAAAGPKEELLLDPSLQPGDDIAQLELAGNHSLFPMRFVPPWSVGGAADSATRPQRLITCGSRLWGSGGWMDARSLLGIRVYEFAVYVDEDLGRTSSPASSTPQPRSPLRFLSANNLLNPGAAAQTPLTAPVTSYNTTTGLQMLQQLLTDNTIPVSIILRASRDLPIDVLQTEMRSVLERRYCKAGGSLPSPQLTSLLQCFTATRLPDTHQHKQQVKKGATMAFMRSGDGSLLAAAFPLDGSGLLSPLPGYNSLTTTTTDTCAEAFTSNRLTARQPPVAASTHHHDSLWSCSSDESEVEEGQGRGSAGGRGVGGVSLLPAPLQDPRISQALLDMYIGDQPVSKKAKGAAVEALHAAVRSGAPPVYRPPAGQQLQCGTAGSSNPLACVVQVA